MSRKPKSALWDEVRRLRAENSELRSENEGLQRKITELKAFRAFVNSLDGGIIHDSYVRTREECVRLLVADVRKEMLGETNHPRLQPIR